jgi:hypothetical protein
MVQWANFEAAAPMLASQGSELIERFRFCMSIADVPDKHNKQTGTG